MPERHRGQPVDADVDVLRAVLAPGEVEVAAARRARADEQGIVTLGHQLLQPIDIYPAFEFDSDIQDITHLLVNHFEPQAEARALAPDHATRARVPVERRDL